MAKCPNINCDNNVFSKKHLRCMSCRRYNRISCSTCGTELQCSRAIRCRECAKDVRALQMRERKRLNKTKGMVS
jgi:hypothetical protein